MHGVCICAVVCERTLRRGMGERTRQERRGEERTAQDRTGQDRRGEKGREGERRGEKGRGYLFIKVEPVVVKESQSAGVLLKSGSIEVRGYWHQSIPEYEGISKILDEGIKKYEECLVPDESKMIKDVNRSVTVFTKK